MKISWHEWIAARLKAEGFRDITPVWLDGLVLRREDEVIILNARGQVVIGEPVPEQGPLVLV